ncbi:MULTISPECIES: pirin family protein [Arthrobacter]|uniref:Pirin family protein n=2 Tax=Arthrobacter TaxID=1663 RepID=A0ABU9KM68_9MICC|nr:pirin family protein [Arthrobacter sp. YJM1]MDP5227081.1 pirin family protein [Arthrobacter sp. YJM1]
MTNLDPAPVQQACPALGSVPDPALEILPERAVPLGGVRAITVNRTLPLKELPTIGPWCFLDRFGPDRSAMTVLPHPHIGLQTVTWPLKGEIRHRDSLGSDVTVRPGELNLMTAGHGISHSEFTCTDGDEVPVQEGLQFWVALPDGHRHQEPSFERHVDLPKASGPGWEATVVMGTFARVTSPASVFSPIVGAQLEGSGGLDLPLDPGHEHALLVLNGGLSVEGVGITPGPLLYLGGRRETVRVMADPDTRFFLLGGEPLGEDLLMWWNFVGRSHEEILQARLDWEADGGLYTSDGVEPGAAAIASSRFGWVPGHQGGPAEADRTEAGHIPAPPLPSVTLKPRIRRR